MANHVKPYLGTKLLTQVTASDLRKLYETLKQSGKMNPRPGQCCGLSSTTVHGVHTTLHHILKDAKNQGLIPINPADKVEPPKVIRQLMKILNEGQLDAFRQLKKFLAEAGLPNIRFHDLRHPYVKPTTNFLVLK